ncbi:putative transmembrane protein [Cedratvirus kamchatka]|uniref:Transmembrane protein n=1 Tax=Cedratvirus kamchatka TaxID=2716914 RepID=A0A6G8MXX0_9VIRU|nr:putative transmembrane protein [Cedratvirus kamchatka]
MLDYLFKFCLFGVGSVGALLGIGCASLIMKTAGAHPSSSIVYGIIGGTLGAMTSYSLVFVGGSMWLIAKILR